MGLPKLTSTQVPDVIFDRYLSILSGTEIKVLMYLIRRTYGFKKEEDRVSLFQFRTGITTKEGKVLDTGCGCSSRAIIKALDVLEKMKLITSIKPKNQGRGQATLYQIVIKDEKIASFQIEKGAKNAPFHGEKGAKNDQERVQKSNIQQYSIQQTDNTRISDPRILFVFDLWKHNMNLNGHTQLTPHRREKIVARLKDSTLEEIVWAIIKCKDSPFHQGENNQGTKYIDLADHILKSRDRVERWNVQVKPGSQPDFLSDPPDLRKRWEELRGQSV